MTPAWPAHAAGPVVAVGGSAGSLGPLTALVAGLPKDLNAPVLVTIHTGEQTRSRLARILSRSGKLPAKPAEDGERVESGCIYVACPGRHLLVGDGTVALSPGPRVNRHRPAVDVLFASSATWAGARTVAVVLSGVLDDGAVGAALVAHAGGRIVVQDPAGAEFAGMPQAALLAAPGAWSAPPAGLARAVLTALDDIEESDLPRAEHQGETEEQMRLADSDDTGFLSAEESRLTRLTCPDCGGSLAQVDLPQITYFRCHVGHQFAPRTLAAAQAEISEGRLWSAVTALEEQAAVQRYLNRRPSEPDGDTAEERRLAADLADRAAQLREQVRKWTAQPPTRELDPD